MRLSAKRHFMPLLLCVSWSNDCENVNYLCNTLVDTSSSQEQALGNSNGIYGPFKARVGSLRGSLPIPGVLGQIATKRITETDTKKWSPGNKGVWKNSRLLFLSGPRTRRAVYCRAGLDSPLSQPTRRSSPLLSITFCRILQDDSDTDFADFIIIACQQAPPLCFMPPKCTFITICTC